MIYKYLILLIGVYIAASFVNFIPSIKYPDYELNVIQLIMSSVFLIVLLIFVKKRHSKVMKAILLIGIFSSLYVFFINQIESQFMNHFILEGIASLQYPLYLIFVTPMFGINYLLKLDYGILALIVTIFYLSILLLSLSPYQKGDAPQYRRGNL